jgi:hypothetical protein
MPNYEEDYDYDYDYDYESDDDDYSDSRMSYTQQCWADRADYANEMLERGEICPIQAAEIRMGA